jgi:hypothetical protein
MPKWWPWGRSKHPDPEPAAPAFRSEPAWHRLAPVQRTIGDIEPTAHLQGFTASLTTSQNPAFTGPLELLTTEHAARLPVLDVVHHSVDAAAPTSSASPRQSRTWAPSPMAVQRAIRQSAAAVQRAADVAAPTREIHPVQPLDPTDTPPHSMIEAPEPDDRRILDVASAPAIETYQPQSVESLAPQPSRDREDNPVDDGVVASVSHEPVSPTLHSTSPTEPSRPTVQLLPSTPDPVSAAQQVVSATSTRSTTSLSPPLRHLPLVQRAVTESPSAAEGFAIARPIPLLRTIESPAGGPRQRGKPDTTTTCDGGPTLQCSIDHGPAHPVATESATPMPLSTRPASDVASQVAPAVDTYEPTASPPVTAQLTTAPTDELKPAPAGHSSAPDAVVTSSPLAGLQRLPVVETRSATTAAGATPEHRTAARPTVQRSPEWPTVQRSPQRPPVQRSPERTTETVSNVHIPTDQASGASVGPGPLPPAGEGGATPDPTPETWGDSPVSSRGDSPAPESYPHGPAGGCSPPLATKTEASQAVTSERLSEASWESQSVSDGAALQHAVPPTSSAGVVQRVALPVVRPAAPPMRIESPPTPSHSASSAHTVVQRAATSGRLVVLPPVRTNSSTDDAPSGASSGPARSVLVESPRPVGLQRMFEQRTARRIEDTTDCRASDAASVGFDSAASSASDSGVPRFETSGRSHEPTANTITFSSPTVQREPEVAAPSPEPAPTAAPAATTISASAAAGPAPSQDVDELVNRLYDPLAARLRAELWLDRERAGVLMDLGR